MTEVEKRAWNAFVAVVKGFLGNTKAANYKDLVEILHDSFDVSDEHGEPFHQDIKVMEERYQGRWNTHMMADYCCSIQRDCVDMKHSRLSRKFVP